MFSAYDARQPQITFDHTHTQEQQGSCTNEGWFSFTNHIWTFFQTFLDYKLFIQALMYIDLKYL